ncbi:hypothetical protein ABXZ36_05295 [Sediminicola arcticus]|uniref:Uncharacterized protein n=1 Tax=Sediminicola arcticus TaxID=1574308 RepID=A0ABV2SSE1_9FLAO
MSNSIYWYTFYNSCNWLGDTKILNIVVIYTLTLEVGTGIKDKQNYD